jgi:hypothetical protein
MLQGAKLLKHKILLVYFMAVDFVMEARSVRLQDLDFDKNSSCKGKEKTVTLPLSVHLMRG